MATKQKLTQHFLTCTVCHEIFTDPSTLACGHSFCGQCIVNFTETKPDAVSAKSIPCPFCRRLTRVPYPTRPVEEWAGQMKPTLLLKGLLDTIGPGAKETTICNLCYGEGETIPSVAWCSVCDVSLCSACLRTHRQIPATSHHDVSEMPEEVKIRRKNKVMCHEHKEEFVKFFCKDCEKTLCQSCCILYHRKCESVVSLESMLPEMKTLLEARKETLMKKLIAKEGHLVSLESDCSELDETKSTIQTDIHFTAQKAIDAIRKKEKTLTDELNDITDNQMNKLRAEMENGDMAIQIYRQQSEFLDHALNSDSETDIYDIFRSYEYETEESACTSEERKTRTKIELSRDLDEFDQALDKLSIGEIQVLDDVLSTESKPVLISTTDCRTKEDEGEPSLYDIKYLEVIGLDVLVVTDHRNKSIKSFFKADYGQRHSQLKMPSSPYCIARIEDNRLAITLPETKQIAKVVAFPGLHLMSTITTNKEYLSLTALTPKRFAAGSPTSHCVDILSESGFILQSISPVHSGQYIIQYPNFLCTSKQGHILMSDKGTGTVLCLTAQGDILFDTVLQEPKSILSTATGHILVVDYYGSKVVQLSESGQFVRDIATSQDPYAIDYDETGTLYVIDESETGDVIKKFTFK